MLKRKNHPIPLAVLLLSMLTLYSSHAQDITHTNKTIPERYQTQITEALSYYPELKNTHIEFVLLKDGWPFVSRPTVFSTFFRRAKKRRYKILIAENSNPFFNPILMKNMPYKAQVGVIGHELAHTADFARRNVFQMIRVALGNLSKRYLNQFESDTDRRAIAHGMGCQLLAWSEWTRSKLVVTEETPEKLEKEINQTVVSERYLNPSTIRQIIQKTNHPPCGTGILDANH